MTSGGKTSQPTDFSSDPLAMAILSVVNAMRQDFGKRFMSQFEPMFEATETPEENLRFWKRRAYHLLRDIPPGEVIDGYARAVKEREPHMPNLNELVLAIKALHGERTRAAEQIETASMPRIPAGTGLAGVIEHLSSKNRGNDLAQQHIALMREAAKPYPVNKKDKGSHPFVAYRWRLALAHHDDLLAKMPQHKERAEFYECQAAGCRKRGTNSHNPNGEGPRFCREHFRHD